MHSLNRQALSLSRRGAWGQVTVAAMLITVLPLLIFAWMWKSHVGGTPLPSSILWSAGVVVVVIIVLGYALLIKYPVNIVRLRRYLGTLAAGAIPDHVALANDEDDLAALQHHMESIVRMAEDRIRMLEKKHTVELEAERQRVMVESIGAMCHHLGQPAAVIGMCIYRLRQGPSPAEIIEIVDESEEAFETIRNVLERLRTLARYASEPYLGATEGEAMGEGKDRILKI